MSLLLRRRALLSPAGSEAPDPGGWSPTDLPDLEAWWDASDTASIIASAGDVSQLNDKSGNGRHLSQATAALQPRTGDSTRNGLNVLDFDADWLQAATAAPWKFLHDGTKHHVFGVFRPANVESPEVRYAMMGTVWSGSDVGAFVTYDDRMAPEIPNRLQHLVAAGGAGLVAFQSVAGVLPGATWSLWQVRADPSNATEADRSFVTVGDGMTYNENSYSATPASADPTAPLKLGGSAESPELYVGKFAELFMCSAELTSGQVADAVEYLQAKWDLEPLELPDVGWTSLFWSEDPAWTPPSDGAGVDRWPDAGSQDVDMVQSSGSLQPAYRAAAGNLNGRAALDFDGDWMDTESGLSMPSGKPWTVALIVRRDTAGKTVYPYDRRWEGETGRARLLYRQSAQGGPDWVGSDATADAVSFDVGTSLFPELLVLEADGSGNLRLWRDNILIGSASGGDADGFEGLRVGANNGTTLGGAPTATGNLLDGLVGILGAVNRVLTNEERARLTEWAKVYGVDPTNAA